MAKIVDNIVTLDRTDTFAIERLITLRLADHPEDKPTSQFVGALGEVAVQAWARHHGVLGPEQPHTSACNVVLQHGGGM